MAHLADRPIQSHDVTAPLTARDRELPGSCAILCGLTHRDPGILEPHRAVLTDFTAVSFRDSLRHKRLKTPTPESSVSESVSESSVSESVSEPLVSESL